jgi:hypothetical protein
MDAGSITVGVMCPGVTWVNLSTPSCQEPDDAQIRRFMVLGGA